MLFLYGPDTTNRGHGRGWWFNLIEFESNQSVHRAGYLIKNKIFHACKRGLLAGLAPVPLPGTAMTRTTPAA